MLSDNTLINKSFKNKSIVLVVIISLLLLIQGCYNKDNIEVWFITDGARYDTVIVNDKATLPVEPVKEGYVFCGWYFDDNTFNDRLTVESFKDNLLTTNKSVYAKWVKVNGVNNTDISLDKFTRRTNDYFLHVKNDTDTINLDELITISPASKYIISNDSAFTNTIDKVVNLNTGDNTYYVKVINENTLESVIYTLSIYRNKMFEVTLISYDNNVYKVIEVEENDRLVLEDITREHYTFDGWDYDLTKPLKEDLTIHAKWTLNSYEITYISDDKVIKKELLPYDSDISYLANKDYNTFDRWYSDETYSYPVTKVTNDMSVYAKWIPIEYNVTCDLNGGIGPTSYTYNYYTVLTLDKPDKEGYTFIGWKYNGVTFENITLKNSYGDKEYIAEFKPNTYIITYDVNGGEINSNPEDSFVYDEPYTLRIPTRNGYTFDGWYYDGDRIENGIWKTSFDIVISAQWITNTYFITYEDNGVTINDNPLSYTIEDRIELVEPVKTGYTFTGWTNSDITAPSKQVIIDKGTTGNKSYIANFEANTYTITYDVNGGDPLTSNTQEVVYDSEYTLLTPVKNNYHFVGWYNLNEEVKNGKWKITSDVTLIAKWFKLYEENGNTYVEYGSYPQSVVLDNTLISNLNTITTINSNGYYEYEGKEYTKVVAEPYGNDYKFSNNETTIIKGITYYFLVEPIKWRVLSDTSDEYFLLSEYLLDKHEFYPNKETRTINGKTIYSNNYEYSTIREWLNNDFYNKAFSNKEKELIKEILVDNSLSTTYSNENPYICNDTLDKIFLLSVQDVMNASYGFDFSYNGSITRESKTTDYARAIGCGMASSSSYYGNGYYWLRSPYSINDYNIYDIHYDGYISDISVDYKYRGIRAAFIIQK